MRSWLRSLRRPPTTFLSLIAGSSGLGLSYPSSPMGGPGRGQGMMKPLRSLWWEKAWRDCLKLLSPLWLGFGKSPSPLPSPRAKWIRGAEPGPAPFTLYFWVGDSWQGKQGFSSPRWKAWRVRNEVGCSPALFPQGTGLGGAWAGFLHPAERR